MSAAGYRPRVEDLKQTPLDDSFKGIPLGAQVPLGAVGEQGWNLARSCGATACRGSCSRTSSSTARRCAGSPPSWRTTRTSSSSVSSTIPRRPARWTPRSPVIVTAGVSMYFDRVIDALGGWSEASPPASLVLRSGCYVSHDGGEYETGSPLAGRRGPGEELRLVNALTLWATALSRPEPDTLIVGAGRRDAPVDRGLPRPRASFRDGVLVRELDGEAEAYRVMDQHLFLRVAPGVEIRPGDLITFDLSHPCTAFDKFRFVPLVNARADVEDAILTFF